jgi:anti-sigma factor RsiW
MIEPNLIKMQAYLDGELPERESREVKDWLSKDLQAKALYEELANTKTLLHGNEPVTPFPCAPDFYWSQIQRQIAVTPTRTRVPRPWFSRWWKLLVPTSAMALFALMLSLQSTGNRTMVSLNGMEIQTEIPNANVMTYRSDDQGISVVWIGTND